MSPPRKSVVLVRLAPPPWTGPSMGSDATEYVAVNCPVKARWKISGRFHHVSDQFESAFTAHDEAAFRVAKDRRSNAAELAQPPLIKTLQLREARTSRPSHHPE
jgi:hypothetical protein